MSGSSKGQTEFLFYHLEHQSLERVLPGLLERTLERGWRAVVHCGDAARLEALDLALWTYRPDSFLPHGTKKDGPPELQPIYLTLEDETPNDAGVCFLVEGAGRVDFTPFIRVVMLFDGHDEAALSWARAQWQAAKAAGFSVTYWRQDESGRWQKRN